MQNNQSTAKSNASIASVVTLRSHQLLTALL